MKFRLSLLTLALVSCSALAQDAAKDGGRFYGEEDSLKLVSDGFYARITDADEAYVATTPAGHRALLQKLVEVRASTPIDRKAAALGYDVPNFFDDLIATLGAPAAKNEDVFGDCTGPDDTGPLRAQALAGGGFAGGTYGASGLASNATTPVVNTTNVVTAAVYDVDHAVLAQQTTTQYGATTAYATAYNAAHGCFANSKSTVTCPGHTSPSITAIGISRRQFPTQCTPP
jgi:hypothetical protein